MCWVLAMGGETAATEIWNEKATPMVASKYLGIEAFSGILSYSILITWYPKLKIRLNIPNPVVSLLRLILALLEIETIWGGPGALAERKTGARRSASCRPGPPTVLVDCDYDKIPSSEGWPLFSPLWPSLHCQQTPSALLLLCCGCCCYHDGDHCSYLRMISSVLLATIVVAV